MLLVGREHGHDTVTRFDEGEVHEVVGADCTVCDEDVVDRLPLVQGGHSRAKTVGAFDRPVGELEGQQLLHHVVAMTRQIINTAVEWPALEILIQAI